MAKFPEDLKYTENDEWIRVEGDTGTIGLTDHAQEQLSDIVYVEFPDVGDVLEAGEVFGIVESVKAAADMHVPVGGEVLEVNETLEDEPETVNSAPYTGGWFIKIKISDPAELDGLMDAAKYKAHCDASA